MDGQSQLYLVAVVIGAVVIIAMALCFALLFYVYTKREKKVLVNGLDDPILSDDLEIYKKKYLKYLKKNYKPKPWYKTEKLNSTANSRTIMELREDEEPLTDVYVSALNRQRKKNKLISMIEDGVYTVLVIIALGLAGIGIFAASSGQLAFLGDTAYMVIRTGSMETAHSNNTYLTENGLEERIKQNSMIGVRKVDDISDIDNYDIVAFYDYDGNIIVHRVISIRENERGELVLQTRGDANSASMDDEMAIGEDRLIGVYTGFQNYGLGVAATYLKSTLGIIALVGFGAFLIAYSCADSAVMKTYDRRLELVAEMKDEEALKALPQAA